MRVDEIEAGLTYGHDGMDLPRKVEKIEGSNVTYTAKDLGPFEMPVSQFAKWAKGKIVK